MYGKKEKGWMILLNLQGILPGEYIVVVVGLQRSK